MEVLDDFCFLGGFVLVNQATVYILGELAGGGSVTVVVGVGVGDW